jgi:hypothetical protein
MDSIKSFSPKTNSELNELFKKLFAADLNYSIIIDLTGFRDINFLKDIRELSNFSKINKKSLVIVSCDLSCDQVNVVPTLSEAYDLIELEEIERDLLS